MKKRILIVDDTEDIVQFTSEALQASGYAVEAAYGGEECLEKVEHFQPDLILLDIMMEDLDGFKVLERLEEMGVTSKAKIAFFTVKHAFEEDMKPFMDDPRYHYLRKPLSIGELLKGIEDIFNSK